MEETRDAAVEVQQKPEEWYRQVNYEDSKIFIRMNLKSAVRSFIAIGYYLKHIRDGKLYKEDGHETIWDFAMAEYGLSKSTASRYMIMNDRFSQDGNSPLIDSRYKGFDKSKLQEMLSLTGEQLEHVTPDMKVLEIRSMRAPKEIPYFEIEGQLDLATDFPEVVPEPIEQSRPEARTFMLNVADLVGDDVEPEEVAGAVATVATGPDEKPEMDYDVRSQYCNAVARKLIESKYDWMREDYKNRVLLVDESEKQLKELLLKGDSFTWYFSDPYGAGVAHVNFFPDYIQFFNGECGGWVGDCRWFYLCAAIQSMWNEIALEKAAAGAVAISQQQEPQPEPEAIDAEFTEVEEPHNEELTDLQIARQELERATRLFEKCLNDVPDETNIYIRGMKIKAAALESYVRALGDNGNPPPQPEQPELPLLKNNDQRAAFVDAYETWPLWIETKETGERYYRYDLPDGTSMVVKVYHAMLFDYSVTGLNYEELFSEGYGRHEYYLLRPGKFFKDCEANRSALIEKLKDVQKKMENPKIGTKMYTANEHLYYVKGRSGPLTEYCVCEGIVKEIRNVGYAELCLKAKDADGHEQLLYYPIKEIGKSVFYTPGEAALLARDKTEQYEKTWERILKEPLRRTWEHYLVEEKG